VRILAVCGSLQARSSNLALLQAVAASPPDGAEVVLSDHLRALPLFDPDLEASPPEPVALWRAAIAGSDALLVACPEYGFSLPGALKNGIDWVIGSGELERKPVAVTASVNHPDRGRKGLDALLGTLAAVSARVVGGEPLVRGDGFDRALGALLAALVAEANKPASREGLP